MAPSSLLDAINAFFAKCPEAKKPQGATYDYGTAGFRMKYSSEGCFV